MYKIFIRNIFILTFPIITLGSDFAFAHRKFDIKNKTNIQTEKLINIPKNNFADKEISASSQNNVDDNLMKSFDNYPSFEESMGPVNQLKNLFGNNDRKLKKSVFRLWETYEKEMSKQLGSERLNGTDINNTFNDSFKSLSK